MRVKKNKKLFGFIRGMFGRIFYLKAAGMMLLAFFQTGAQFLLILYLGKSMDSVSDGYRRILYYFGSMVIVLIFYTVCSALFTFLSGCIAAGLSVTIQKKLGEKLCLSRYQEIEQIKDGELLVMMTKDVEAIKEWFSSIFRLGRLPAQIGISVLFCFFYY